MHFHKEKHRHPVWNVWVCSRPVSLRDTEHLEKVMGKRRERGLVLVTSSFLSFVQRGHLIPIIRPQISGTSPLALSQKAVNSLGPGRGNRPADTESLHPLANGGQRTRTFKKPEKSKASLTSHRYFGLLNTGACAAGHLATYYPPPFSYQTNWL